MSGGFHLLLAAFKASGKPFAFSHFRESFSLWRRTYKLLDWVMESGDPNQVEDKLMKIVLE
jgi:hypothetical protein